MRRVPRVEEEDAPGDREAGWEAAGRTGIDVLDEGRARLRAVAAPQLPVELGRAGAGHEVQRPVEHGQPVA